MKIILLSAKAQHGKDQSATFLKEIMDKDNKRVLITHYADLLKYICKTFFEWDGNKDEKGRTILQKVGTDVIRIQNPDYWVDFISEFLHMFDNEWDYVLIPDTRFPNEVNKMMEDGFDVESIRINRIDFENSLTEAQRQHPSETALDDFKFDYYIDTISNLDILKEELEIVYESIKSKDGE